MTTHPGKNNWNWLVFILVPLLFFACHTNSSPENYSASGYQKQKLSLEQQEKQDPLRFISSKGTYRKNVFGRFVLDGTIINTATIATYKDVVLEIKFYSQTETLLSTKQHTFYEYYPPGSTKIFQLKLDGDEGAAKIGWEVVGAVGN